ncbi:MAG: putative peptidoglycan endopeptidase LytE precursor [Chloroflexi bacterium ADurb.Bin325]|nr:MAG: putative peptidoglycan endopeptidase LytE precursor [Chloroflexi bacterium ADurb.Bin325]
MYCKRCGAPLHQGVVLCPECGARQRRRIAAVTCSNCHSRVPLGLSVCPHCGRNLRPAGPRWGAWLAGLAVVGVVGLWGLGKLPVESAIAQVTTTRERLASLVQVIGPVRDEERPAKATSAPQELAMRDEKPPATEAAPPTAAAAAEQPATPTVAVEQASATPAATATPVAAPPTDAPTEAPTDMPTATPTLEPTAEPTATPTPEPNATPTLEPTAAPTATPAPPAGQVTYKVKSGDTLSAIAARYNIDWETLARANGLSSRSVLQVGQELKIPTAGSAAAAAPAAPRAEPTKYKVQSGDNLSIIAGKFGITWEELARANGLTSKSVLRIGQELTIPVAGSAAAPTATKAPPATAVAQATVAATATAAPPPAPPPAPDLPAPVLVGPGDQASYRGNNAIIELQWNPVPGMTAAQQYQIVVRWVEQGGPQEHWWVTTAAGSRVPTWLYLRADQPDRKYTWFVRVVQVTTDGQGGERVIPLSPSSGMRAFYWG